MNERTDGRTEGMKCAVVTARGEGEGWSVASHTSEIVLIRYLHRDPLESQSFNCHLQTDRQAGRPGSSSPK